MHVYLLHLCNGLLSSLDVEVKWDEIEAVLVLSVKLF